MRIKNFLKLIIVIVVCEVVGIGGAFFTSPAVSSTWYAVFYKISKPAALLLLPYILWVSFASHLNYSILILNL